MRTLILISFFACIYLHFQNQEAVVLQLDSLSTKQSSIRPMVSPKVELPAITHIQSAPNSETSGFVPSENEHMITQNDISEEFEEDEISQLPWDDIEEGWKTHLKEFLVSIDPEKAEDMFSAYMEEKKKYVERVDFTDQENGESHEAIEEDGKEGEIERLHSENLKEIFGDHYSKVESLHQEYVDSVQYLNRSSVKFSISL